MMKFKHFKNNVKYMYTRYILLLKKKLEFEPSGDADCFAYTYYNSLKKQKRSIQIHVYKGEQVESKNLSTLNSFYSYEENNGSLTPNNIISFIQENQKKLSEHMGCPVISYLTNINGAPISDNINIRDHDIQEFENLIANIDNSIEEISIILHSLGGRTEATHKIVEFIRSRFKKVNYIVPSTAHSAAAMMCMSGDKIILTPTSSLGPFDIYIPSPLTKRYLPATEMLKLAKEAKQVSNPFNIFISSKLYEGWNAEIIRNTIFDCKSALKRSKQYPSYWLSKYMFRSDKFNFINYTNIPFWKLLSRKGRKINRIVNLFVNTGTKLSHDTPIMYNDLKDMGLNVELAENELLDLIRETSLLSTKLFERSTITKLYISSNVSTYRYYTDQQAEKET